MQIFRSSARVLVLCGAVALPLTLAAQTFTTLYDFGSQDHDGIYPTSRVIFGPQGQLYGTTPWGGDMSQGTVYELIPPASAGGAWTEKVLHSFNHADGGNPNAALLPGPQGALYGVTLTSASNYGTAFELDPPVGGGTNWHYSVIHRFTSGDGSYPSGALAFGLDQLLYGATRSTVYSLTPPAAPGAAWTETTLDIFPTSHGTDLVGTLAVSGNGTLFGAAAYGGTGLGNCIGCGTVFSLMPPAVPGGPWTNKVLHAFGAQAGDGTHPSTGIFLTPDGVLYGATSAGGAGSMGTVFSLTKPTTAGTPMIETILHAFSGPDGTEPAPVLLPGPIGVLYGTTLIGGPNSHGTVFELIPPVSAGGDWTETILHSFTGGLDGSEPAGLALASDGTLYGTTNSGGTFGRGTVFALKP